MNMKMNFSMNEIRLKVEEYIKKGGRGSWSSSTDGLLCDDCRLYSGE